MLISNNLFSLKQVPSAIEHNLLIQLFSPLIASQNVMSSQFDNPYSTITCHDGTAITLQQVGFKYCQAT